MDSFDVLIVGGGPAGSTCARALHRAGLRVAIIDKAEFPRDKVCAGWVTPQVVESLDIDLQDYARSRVLQPITAFTAALGVGPQPSASEDAKATDHAAPLARGGAGLAPDLSSETAPVKYDRVVSYGIRRCEFDHYLLQRSGAQLRLGEPCKTMTRQDGAWLVNGQLRAPLLVGAGGHFCPVARFLGAQLGRDERAIAAQEIEFEMSEDQAARCGVAPEQPELYFCEDLKGYGWCFRKGNFLNVGLGREGNHRLAEQVQAFSRWLQARGKVPADAPARFKGHAYLLYAHAARPVVGEGLLVIGDAAGLAYTQSGEGIRPAIESGMLAAQTITAAAGDYREERLRDYEVRLRARFGARDGGRWSGLVPQGLRMSLARALMQTQWFRRRVLLDRWFLHANLSALPRLPDIVLAPAAAA